MGIFMLISGCPLGTYDIYDVIVIAIHTAKNLEG